MKETSANLIIVPFMFKLPPIFFQFMSIVQSLPKNKPFVICAIIAIIGIATAPGLAPHVFHGMHMVDLVMHQTGIALASILTFLSINSYFMTKSKKMIVVSIAFALFACAELIQLIESEKHHIMQMNMDMNMELNLGFWSSPMEWSHIMSFGMLVLFAIAIFRRN